MRKCLQYYKINKVVMFASFFYLKHVLTKYRTKNRVILSLTVCFSILIKIYSNLISLTS